MIVLLAVYGAILALGRWGGTWLGERLQPEAGSPLRTELLVFIVLSFVLYIAMLAVPFVPGMEISLAILAALGSRAAVPIYIATIVALCIAYLAGRLVSVRALAAVFNFLGLNTASALALRLGGMTPGERFDALLSATPTRIFPFLLKHRYLAIAAALNTPGNAVIGGGGGIAMLAGMSGLFSFSAFALTLCIAALPVPAAILLASRY